MSHSIAGPEPEPNGFLVLVDQVTRIHFLDWGAPPAAEGPGPSVLLVHGLSGTGWVWGPVARRLARHHHVAALDLRGHGLSDAPTDGYDLEGQAGDALAVAEGAGLLDDGAAVVIAGHGFGAMVAAELARRLGQRCAGLVLVDGGWEAVAESTGLEPVELLRGLEEPPEILRSMAAYLADRAAFDPATWDDHQERIARAAVVELPAGRVVPVARPHVLEACVMAMYGYRPGLSLAAVSASIAALIAADDDAGDRRIALRGVQAALRSAGRPVMAVVDLPEAGHNLMRYRPEAVAAAIETVADGQPAYHPES